MRKICPESNAPQCLSRHSTLVKTSTVVSKSIVKNDLEHVDLVNMRKKMEWLGKDVTDASLVEHCSMFKYNIREHKPQ